MSTHVVELFDLRDGSDVLRSSVSFRCPNCGRRITRFGGKRIPALGGFVYATYKSCGGCETVWDFIDPDEVGEHTPKVTIES